MNKKVKKTTSCGAIAWRTEGSKVLVLLIKQFSHNESWGIPKGHTDDGESVEDCARREVREETGVNVVLGRRLGDVRFKSKKEDKTVVTFLARAKGDTTPRHDDPDNEVADARWHDIDDLPKLVVYQRPVIEEAVIRIRNVVSDGDAINSAMERVHRYAPALDEWITVKKELLKNLPSEHRTMFSTRDPITKKQRTNDFERLLIKRWSSLTGREVVLPPT